MFLAFLITNFLVLVCEQAYSQCIANQAVQQKYLAGVQYIFDQGELRLEISVFSRNWWFYLFSVISIIIFSFAELVCFQQRYKHLIYSIQKICWKNLILLFRVSWSCRECEVSRDEGTRTVFTQGPDLRRNYAGCCRSRSQSGRVPSTERLPRRRTIESVSVHDADRGWRSWRGENGSQKQISSLIFV